LARQPNKGPNHVAHRRWFARDDGDSDTGPFPSLDDAREWVKAIRP
jgi:hypothetical protein